MKDDLIRRSTAIDAAERKDWILEAMDSVQDGEMNRTKRAIARILAGLPSAQPEPLTDKEKRIFLVAMRREEEVCRQIDAKYHRKSYEDSLVRTCHEIIRKVKGALWMI